MISAWSQHFAPRALDQGRLNSNIAEKVHANLLRLYGLDLLDGQTKDKFTIQMWPTAQSSPPTPFHGKSRHILL